MTERRDVERSLDVSWKEGIPAAIMLGVLDYYLVPFALFLGARPFQIGILVAMPFLLAALSQLWAVSVVRSAGSRLDFLVRGTALQAAFLVPASLLALFPNLPHRVGLLIACAAAFRVLGNFIGAAWGSLMSDYLEPEERGHYFGWRAQVVGVAGLAGVTGAGVLLYATKLRHPALGFFLLFLGAALCRFASYGLMTRMADIPHPDSREHDFTFIMFLRRFRSSNFVRFVFFVAGITFATQLSAPYFSVFQLRDLHFNYLQYMLLQFCSVGTGLLSAPIWGKHADIVGNAKILKITGFFIPFIPLLWLVSRSLPYLVAVELTAGFMWGGFNLCAVNFVLDAVSAPKRVRCLAYFNLINGAAVCAGALLGGFLAERLPPLFGWRILSLFALSGALRFAAALFLSGGFREVRKSRHVSSLDLFFSVVGFRSLAGMNQEWSFIPGRKHRPDKFVAE